MSIIVDLKFKCNPGETNGKFITSQSFLSSDGRNEFKKRATNCCTRFWSLVTVRNQLPAQSDQWKTYETRRLRNLNPSKFCYCPFFPNCLCQRVLTETSNSSVYHTFYVPRSSFSRRRNESGGSPRLQNPRRRIRA